MRYVQGICTNIGAAQGQTFTLPGSGSGGDKGSDKSPFIFPVNSENRRRFRFGKYSPLFIGY